MNTLIIYATKHGATKSCAEKLSEKLTGKTDLYDVKNGSISELSQYDKVIIGGSIYAGSIPKELKEFCMKNKDILQQKKLGLYICCMNEKEAEKQLNSVFPEELLSCAISKESFGGEFKFKEMNFFEKLICKMVTKMLAKEDPSVKLDMKEDVCKISKDSIDRMANKINAVSI